jgi:tetratricopeptide (TPR) repeat protein
VLYELLSGKLPQRFEGTAPWSLTVKDAPPAPPSTMDRRVAGDLDNIVLRALEKEPGRRYQTVAELADDVRRYLQHQPVTARPATWGYRTGKFLRRNHWKVAAVAGLVVALGASLYAWSVAQRRLEMVRGLAEKLVVDVHDSIRDLPGATAARQTIVATGLRYLAESEKAARGDARAEQELALAYRKLGDAQGYVVASNLGNTAGALASYAKAKQLLDDAAGRDSGLDATERVIVRERIASVETVMGRTEDALKVFEEGERIGEEAVKRGASLPLLDAIATLHVEAGSARRGAGDWEGAMREARLAMEQYRAMESIGALSAERRHGLATALASLGMAETRANHLPEALQSFRQGVDEMEKLTRQSPENITWRRDLLLGYGHVGDALGATGSPNLGDPSGALQAYRKAAEMARPLYEADRKNLRAIMDYGIVSARVASVTPDLDDEKLVAGRRSIQLLEEAAQINPGNSAIEEYRAWCNQLIGDALRARGDLRAAQDQFQASARHATNILKRGQASPIGQLALTSRRAAENAVALGDREMALKYGRAPLDAFASIKGRTPLMEPRVYGVVGLAYAALAGSRLRQPGDGESAKEWLGKAVRAAQAAKVDPMSSTVLERDMKDVRAALAVLEGKK